MEMGEHCGPEVGALEPRWRCKSVEQCEACGWALPLRERDRSVERVQGGRGQPFEELVTPHDAVPPRRGNMGSEAVLRSDAGFGVIAREPCSLGGARQPAETKLDASCVPQ